MQPAMCSSGAVGKTGIPRRFLHTDSTDKSKQTLHALVAL